MTKFPKEVIHLGKVYFASHFQGFHSIAVWHCTLRDFLRQGITTDMAGKMAVHVAGSRKQGAGTFRA